MARLLWCSGLAACLWAGPVDFGKDIQPMLKTACLPCHTGAQANGGLRLGSRVEALKGGVSGPAIVPGSSQSSRLIQRISGVGSQPRMPLGVKPLEPEQVARLKQWIDEGAVWPESALEKHWAYVKPVRPPVPTTRNPAWARTSIDTFVLARLEKEGLKPSPEAGRETLIRRLSLDLIGLPPSPKKVDEFLADGRPDAYEKLVDRLLASPHYGERWARPWLDLARYADTNGYEKDRRRSIWKYRDWVIRAFNQDLPFDQFTVEQLAGDLLPNATPEQKIATGFHRNTMFNEEGGVDKEEAHWENLVDRVNTTGTVWLASTITCTQCHNHKYDPFTQKEFYQLMAFFNHGDMGVRDYGDTSQKYIEPQLDLPTPEQDARRKAIQQEIKALEAQLKTATPELAAEQKEWEQAVVAAQSDWTPLKVTRVTSSGGTTLTRTAEGSIMASGANPHTDTYTIEARTRLKRITAIRLEALPHPSLPRGGPGRDAYGNFFLSAMEAGNLDARDARADDGRIKDKSTGHLWTVDASREDRRLPRQLVLVARTPVKGGELRITLKQNSEFGGQGLGHFRLSATTAKDPVKIVGISAKLRPLLDTAESARTEEQNKSLAEFYRSVAPSLEAARKRLTRLRKELDELGIASTLILGERSGMERPAAFVRIRGSFLSKGELVEAAVPAALPPLPEGERPNRLGLARWLVSAENPLTARVTVNRIWEQYFGRGIVATAEDFGTQGERPTHPDLLDWLATELIRQNWSMKAIHRLIATSATYRQSSNVAPGLLERDPYNKLLARGPRFRIEAEMIRDVALAASGLLSRKIGGPSVFPYQPD
ncbi:MAG: DUF1549 domain-containing protein [Acidobacteria bacterium]|nr:DUF1549 domain-containing protein [Acidobacteriota bacterium]